MIDGLYQFLRGASGFSFLVIGAGFFVEPGRHRVRKAFGALFVSLGLVFLFSWLSDAWILPMAFDNFLVILAVFSISQSLFEISLYLFGDEAVRGSRRLVYVVGAVWSLLLWLLPFLDPALGLPALKVSVEDGRSMALFQLISSTAVYMWPIAITVVSLRAGRWRLADLPLGPGAARMLLLGFAGLIVILAIIGSSLLFSSQALYRAGHTALELLMLAWFLFLRARPDAFIEARRQIRQQHKQRETIGPEEARTVAERLRRVVDIDRVFVNPELDLNMLAKTIRTPSYRLSSYFNAVLGKSFPEWLNAMRIEYVRGLLVERPEMSILDISIEAGYASKTVFNHQFQRRVGMNPSEYRSGKPG
jgi:AraC-like DNA-binding protein